MAGKSLESSLNHASGQSSAVVELWNAADNLKKAQAATKPEEKNEYYKQAGYSVLLATSNLVGNIVGGLKEDNVLNPYSRTTNGVNGLTIAVRLRGNLEKAIEEHEQGYVNINRFQNILADVYGLAGLAGSLGRKDGSMRTTTAPLAFAGDFIAGYAIKTGDTGLMRVEDFYNMNNFTGFASDLLEQSIDKIDNWLEKNNISPVNTSEYMQLGKNMQQNQDFISQGFAALLSDSPQQGMNQMLNSDYAKTFDIQAKQVLAQDDAQKQQELAQSTPKMVRS